MISFLKQIFTWWHRQTLGTFLYTFFFGKFLGKDIFAENKVYDLKEVLQEMRSHNSTMSERWQKLAGINDE